MFLVEADKASGSQAKAGGWMAGVRGDGAAGKRGQAAGGSWQMAVGSDEAVEAGWRDKAVRAYVLPARSTLLHVQ